MSKTQVFIEKARAVHGDRYDYSKTVYVRARDRVIIVCREHGEFEQTPNNHLSASGCVKCGRLTAKCVRRRSNLSFIEKARAKHGDRYDYSKVVYVRARDKVIITCQEHGDYKQSADNHYKGKGCPKCKGFNKTTKEWIIEAADIHGDRYDYSKVVYVRARDKVIITCQEHGDFNQVANYHLQGDGCPKCRGLNKTSKEWIIEAADIHGNCYDYSKVVYVRARDKVIIACKTHGCFEQSADNHLRGQGCPSCEFDRSQPTAIYLMQMGAQVKIGISIDPDARLVRLNRNNPEPARIVTTWTLKDFPAAYAVEQQLHQRLRDYHAGLTGFDGATEWFNTTPCHAEWVINKAVQYANEVCKL